MLKFLSRFKKPFPVQALDRIPINELEKINARIDLGGEIVKMSPATLVNIISSRVIALVKEKAGVTLDVDLYCPTYSCMHFAMKEFNKEVDSFAQENKLYGWKATPSICGGWIEDGYSALTEKVKVGKSLNAHTEDMTIHAFADLLATMAEQGKKLFDGLKALVEKNRYLLPVVDAIKVTTHFDDIWYIDSISITPEMVDGYMTAVTPVIDDTEATERLREKIINSFRKEVAGSPEKLDYNKPKVSVPEPNAWKKEYYEKIKPEEERRERSKAIIEEIRGSITEHDIMQEVGRRKLKAKLMALTDGEIAKVFPEDYKEFMAIPV